MTSCVPMPAVPNACRGPALLVVRALVGHLAGSGALIVTKEGKTCARSVPFATFGALTACIIAVFTIASGAIIPIPTYLWSLGPMHNIDSAMYWLFWWALGHAAQQIDVAAHVSVCLAIAAIVFGARLLPEKVSRTVFYSG